MLVSSGLFAQGNPRKSSDNQVTTKALIESGAVARVLIFHVPDSTMTRVALTPQALLSIAGSGYEIARGRDLQRGDLHDSSETIVSSFRLQFRHRD